MEVEINPEIICAGKKFAIHELFIQASAAETLKGKKKKKKKMINICTETRGIIIEIYSKA